MCSRTYHHSASGDDILNNVYNNSDIISLGDGEYHELTIEYTDYSEYDKFVDRMKKYGDFNENLIVFEDYKPKKSIVNNSYIMFQFIFVYKY